MSDVHEQRDDYITAIRTVAESAEMSPASIERVERNLEHAFSEFHGLGTRSAALTGRRWHLPWWSAAAAAVAIAAIGIQVWRQADPAVENRAPGAASSRTAPTQWTALAPRPPVSSRRPPTAAPAAVVTGRPASMRAVRPKRTVPAPVIRPFIPLPGSGALPDFESGAIVRMEVPVASLPAYGIDISPAAGGQPIEADVLVGQDGQPRAIRLVTNSARSTQ
jgi:hypothetical protein